MDGKYYSFTLLPYRKYRLEKRKHRVPNLHPTPIPTDLVEGTTRGRLTFRCVRLKVSEWGQDETETEPVERRSKKE